MEKFMKIYIEALNPVISEGERYITFFLSNFPGEKKNFRCLNCGKLLMQYEGELLVGVDSGDKPTEKASLENLCPRCRIVYRFIVI